MEAKARDDGELRKASKSVAYEISMLRATLIWTLSKNNLCQDQALRNAMIHSFLLAARNLLDFYYATKDHQEQILAKHFFDNKAAWRKPDPWTASVLPLALSGKISERLTHLTYKRARLPQLTWKTKRIAWELQKPIDVFADKVNPARVSDEFLVRGEELGKTLAQCVNGTRLADFEKLPFSVKLESVGGPACHD